MFASALPQAFYPSKPRSRPPTPSRRTKHKIVGRFTLAKKCGNAPGAGLGPQKCQLTRILYQGRNQSLRDAMESCVKLGNKCKAVGCDGGAAGTDPTAKSWCHPLAAFSKDLPLFSGKGKNMGTVFDRNDLDEIPVGSSVIMRSGDVVIRGSGNRVAIKSEPPRTPAGYTIRDYVLNTTKEANLDMNHVRAADKECREKLGCKGSFLFESKRGKDCLDCMENAYQSAVQASGNRVAIKSEHPIIPSFLKQCTNDDGSPRCEFAGPPLQIKASMDRATTLHEAVKQCKSMPNCVAIASFSKNVNDSKKTWMPIGKTSKAFRNHCTGDICQTAVHVIDKNNFNALADYTRPRGGTRKLSKNDRDRYAFQQFGELHTLGKGDLCTPKYNFIRGKPLAKRRWGKERRWSQKDLHSQCKALMNKTPGASTFYYQQHKNGSECGVFGMYDVKQIGAAVDSHSHEMGGVCVDIEKLVKLGIEKYESRQGVASRWMSL